MEKLKQTSQQPNQTQPKLFVGGISYHIKRNDLKNYLSQFGELKFLNLIKEKKTGNNKGFAFVCFKTEEATQSILNKRLHYIKGRLVDIQTAVDKKEKQKYEEDLKKKNCL